MEEVKPGKIYGAIAGVIADVGAVSRDKINKTQGFKYRSVDDVFNVLKPALAKNKVVIVPMTLERISETVGHTKNGAVMTKVVCKIKFTFYAEDGSYVTSIIYGEGLDTGDKATNKAMAIAYKYACFQVFCIPTEEMIDPDAERPEFEKEKAQEDKNVAKRAKASEAGLKSKEKVDKETESSATEESRITEAMVNTVRAEQERTGVKDSVILSMKQIKAKSIEELTIREFNIIMKKFKVTGDIKSN